MQENNELRTQVRPSKRHQALLWSFQKAKTYKKRSQRGRSIDSRLNVFYKSFLFVLFCVAHTKRTKRNVLMNFFHRHQISTCFILCEWETFTNSTWISRMSFYFFIWQTDLGQNSIWGFRRNQSYIKITSNVFQAFFLFANCDFCGRHCLSLIFI